MPVASSMGWVGSRVTPAQSHVQGWSLPHPSNPCTAAPWCWQLVLGHRGGGEQLVAPSLALDRRLPRGTCCHVAGHNNNTG